MPSVTRRYTKEEFARRGDALYDKVIRPTFESSHRYRLRRISDMMRWHIGMAEIQR